MTENEGDLPMSHQAARAGGPSGRHEDQRKEGQHQEAAELLDLPIPGVLKKYFFNPLMGNYLYKSDSFEQVMRKMALLVFVLGGFATLGPTISCIINYHRVGYLGDLLPAISGSILCTSFTTIYLSFRLYYKHVSDTMATLMILGASQLWTCLHISAPQHYALLWIDMMIMCLAIVMNVRGLVFIGILHTLLVLQDMYNESFREIGFALQLPERNNVGVERFLLHLMCFFPGCACLVAIWFVSQEQKRQVQAANESVLLAQQIVKELQRYNTEKVQDIVSQALNSGDDSHINKDLLQSFSAMVVNLEKYRPFLPNYLFLSSSSAGEEEEEDDDDEGSISEDNSHSSKQTSKRDGGRRRRRQGRDKRGSVASSHSSRASRTDRRRDHLYDDDDEGSVASYGTSHSTATAHQSFSSAMVHGSTLASPDISTSGGAHHNHHQHGGTATPGSSLGGLSSFRGVVSMALVEVKTSQWFHSPTSVSGKARPNLTSTSSTNNKVALLSKFTDIIFEVARSTKASIHSMIGDTIQLSWNATHRVAQPELKAAQLLLQMKVEAQQLLGSDVQLAGAACSGVAEVHSVFSSKLKQFALFVDAHWLPALTKMSELAIEHRTILVDSNTKDQSSYNVTAQAIDCLRYVPRAARDEVTGDWKVAVAPGAKSLPSLKPVPDFVEDHVGSCSSLVTSLCDAHRRLQREEKQVATAELLGDQARSLQQQQSHSSHRFTLVYELTSLLHQNDHDEWMYQLNSLEKKKKNRTTPALGKKHEKTTNHHDDDDGCFEEAVTCILMLAVRGEFGEAVEIIENLRNSGTLSDSKQQLSSCVKKLFAGCEVQLQM